MTITIGAWIVFLTLLIGGVRERTVVGRSPGLSEDDVPISEGELGEATLLATAMGNPDRVTGPLKLCPRPPR